MSKVLTSDINKFRKDDLVFARESVGVVTYVGLAERMNTSKGVLPFSEPRMIVRVRLTSGFEFPVMHNSELWSQIKVLAKA